jgi:hypothetical protein
MINFEFHAPIKPLGAAKATVQKTGKLAFSSSAVRLMEMDSTRNFRVATNGDNKNDKNLYLLPATGKTADAYKVSKAGTYYMDLRGLFNKLKIDYEAEKVVFNVSKEEQKAGGPVYFKLQRVTSK